MIDAKLIEEIEAALRLAEQMCVDDEPVESLLRALLASHREQERRIAELEKQIELAEVPPLVRIALMTVLNHVEPGWGNCVATVQAWLYRPLDARAAETKAGEE